MIPDAKPPANSSLIISPDMACHETLRRAGPSLFRMCFREKRHIRVVLPRAQVDMAVVGLRTVEGEPVLG